MSWPGVGRGRGGSRAPRSWPSPWAVRPIAASFARDSARSTFSARDHVLAFDSSRLRAAIQRRFARDSRTIHESIAAEKKFQWRSSTGGPAAGSSRIPRERHLRWTSTRVSAIRSSVTILEDLGGGRVGDTVNELRSVAFASDRCGSAIAMWSSSGEVPRQHGSAGHDVVAFEVRR